MRVFRAILDPLPYDGILFSQPSPHMFSANPSSPYTENRARGTVN